MNAVLKASLTRAAFVGGGAVAGASGTIAVTSGAREAVTVVVGDTITPRFSIRTDTVLRVIGKNIVAAKCGTSAIFLRTLRAGQQISADTVTATVTGCTHTPPPVSVVSVCLTPDTVAIAKYRVSGDTTIDPALVPCLSTPAAAPLRLARVVP